MKNILFIIAFLYPSYLAAQSCETAHIYQHISEADTFNSSGAPLTDAAAILQQDRFYVNAKDRSASSRSTPLHYAAGHGHKEIVELLIVKGADVNAKTNIGMTPLYEAAIDGHQRHRQCRKELQHRRRGEGDAEHAGGAPLQLVRSDGDVAGDPRLGLEGQHCGQGADAVDEQAGQP